MDEAPAKTVYEGLVRAEVYAGVYALLEREAEKSRLNADLELSDFVEVLIAKLKALEKKA